MGGKIEIFIVLIFLYAFPRYFMSNFALFIMRTFYNNQVMRR